MPKYEYECPRCGSFSEFRPMAECELPGICPGCGADSPRALLSFPTIWRGTASVPRGGGGRLQTASRPFLAIVQVADAAVVGISKFGAKSGPVSCFELGREANATAGRRYAHVARNCATAECRHSSAGPVQTAEEFGDVRPN